jgi:Flp pilus assembly protein TadD
VLERENVPAQRKAEAWIGLAASYDRLKRFELADRAYKAAIAIVGLTPEVLNNQGFSYMLRGDYMRARAKFSQALEKDPTNPYIQNNIDLLEESIRTGGGRKKV